MMKPEFELLVRCCGLAKNIPVHGSSFQERLSDKFDEDSFVKLAMLHKASSAAYNGLKKLGLSLSPENAKRLKLRAQRYQLVREQIFEGACTIIETAGKYDVPAMVIKGPASSLQLYGDPLVREYDDLDILINLPDIGSTIPFMKDLGYTTEEFAPLEIRSSSENWLLRRPHHVTFWKADSLFRVEMHDRTGWEHELFRRDNIDAVFKRAVTLEYSGKNLTAPDLQDHAVLILAHGVKHTWCLLHWVLDAAVLLSRSEEGFQEAFMARVCGLGLQRQLKLTCDVVRTLYPINLTPAIETLMQNEPRLEYSKSFALDRLQTRNRDQDSIKNTILFTIGYSLPLAGTVMGKIRCILYPLKIWQEDFKAIPLPPYLYFLHFLFRPFFVVSRRLKKRRRNGGSLHG